MSSKMAEEPKCPIVRVGKYVLGAINSILAALEEQFCDLEMQSDFSSGGASVQLAGLFLNTRGCSVLERKDMWTVEMVFLFVAGL